jgi:hypothetical protein
VFLESIPLLDFLYFCLWLFRKLSFLGKGYREERREREGQKGRVERRKEKKRINE